MDLRKSREKKEKKEILTSKSAANMSSDSVNMSGAEGFFGLAPETNKNKTTRQF